MSLLADLTRTFGLEGMEPELAKKLQPLLDHLASNFNSVRNAFAKIDIVENLDVDIVQASFTHAVVQNVALKKLRMARSAVVLACYGAVPSGPPDVAMVGDRQAAVTLWFTDATKVTIPVTLLLLPVGGRSSQS